jgi:DNA-binding NarL/FixJ family response regulator
MADRPFVTTAAALAALAATQRPSGLVEVTGVAGSGRSVLWRHLAGELDSAGRTVLVVRGGRVRFDEPYSAFVRCGEALPPTPRSCAAAIRTLLGEASPGRGGVVLADDVDLFDHESRCVLVELIESAIEGDLTVVLFRRPSVTAAVDEVTLAIDELVALHADRIELGPWSVAEVAELTGAARAGAVREASGGIAAYVAKLAADADVAPLVHARMARVSAQARIALDEGRPHPELVALALQSVDGATLPIVSMITGATAVATNGTCQPSSPSVLSPREREIAAKVLHGLTHREIAEVLYLAPKTVEHHVSRMRQRLGVTTRSAFMAALRHELATL